MKSSKEFFDRMQSDEAFNNEISVAYKERLKAKDDYKVIIRIANEHGYELKEDEIDELYDQTCELSEDELEKVSGGTSPGCIMFSLFTLDLAVPIAVTIYKGVTE